MGGGTAEYSVLIVEDNPDIVIGLEDLLRHDGYDVRAVATCADASDVIRRQRFNAVLLDLGLPDGDGLEVLKDIQQLDPSLPVVILTAHVSAERTVGSLTKGAFACVTKPFNGEELRHTLRRAIGVKDLAAQAQRAERRLTESEDRFRSLVESATDAIVIADGRGVIASWNRAASAMFGYAADEVVGRPLTLLMPARYRERHTQALARLNATGRPHVIGSVVELHGLRKDGAEFPIELSLATWSTAGERFFSGIIRDISERKRTERALEELRNRHTLILTQAGEGIYGVDLAGRTTFVNPSAAAMLGYRPEELLGRHMHSTLHHSRPDGSPYPVEACPIYAAIRDGLVHRVGDEVFWRKDGTSFPVEYVSTPIREDGRVTGAVLVFRDITERRRAEDALQQSRRLLREVVDNTTAVIYVKQPDGRYLLTNRRFEELFGFTADRIVGHTDQELFPPDIAAAFRANDLAVLAQERAMEYEEHAPHADGLHTYISIKFALRDERGAPYAVCGISTDITDRARVETALRIHQEQLRLALTSTDAGAWSWDLRTDRFLWCPQIAVLLDLPPPSGSSTSADLLALVYEDDRAQLARAMKAVPSGSGDHVAFEHRARRSDGRLQWFIWTGHVLRDRRGQAVHVLGTVRAAPVACGA